MQAPTVPGSTNVKKQKRLVLRRGKVTLADSLTGEPTSHGSRLPSPVCNKSLMLKMATSQQQHHTTLSQHQSEFRNMQPSSGRGSTGSVKIFGQRMSCSLWQDTINSPSVLLHKFNLHIVSNLLLINLIPLLLPLLILLAAPHSTSGQPQPQAPLTSHIGGHILPQLQAPQYAQLTPASSSNNPPDSLQAMSRVGSTNLEAPLVRHQPYSHGPGLDLVAMNRRRFELNHHHNGGSSESDQRRGEEIESYLATMPDRVLASLPENMDRQGLQKLAVEAGLLGATGAADGAAGSMVTDVAIDDPDGASIERLTKSCLSVHASSARPEQLNVTFQLFTRKNPFTPFIFWPHITRQELLKASPFDPSKPIKWITHGFHTNLDKSEWMVDTKDRILAYETDSNVILTDWRRGASPALAFYPKAAANAHVVAKMVVNILRRLRNDIDFSRIHLIGHSLGAHIMGFVGSAFTEEYLYEKQQVMAAAASGPSSSSQQRRPLPWREMLQARASMPAGSVPGATGTPGEQLIGRITACDPALPCFGPSSSSPVANSSISSQELLFNDANDWTPSMWTHLRPDSALVVEVMHSNPGVMGYAEPLGDYDFYPNGLERQPGCGGGSHDTTTTTTNTATSADQPPRRKRQLAGYLSNLVWGQVSSLRNNQESRITSTLDRLIKPIRDFFNGYTCSHHRSVEYMVESMYYERVPHERRLDKDLVCQMVGYRCPDYASFKRGFCFECNNPLDCRAFMMSTGPKPSPDWGIATQYEAAADGASQSSRATSQYHSSMIQHQNKFRVRREIMKNNSETSTTTTTTTQQSKRVLPSFNQYQHNYLPQKKNQYFFDTRPMKDYCIHHYHLFVKYRWFRVRGSVTLEGFHLAGTMANTTHLNGATFNRYTYQSYTMLFTEPTFLGNIQSLVLLGDKIMSNFVDYIQVSYLSNLDPKVRALGSARLCKSNGPFEFSLDSVTDYGAPPVPPPGAPPGQFKYPSAIRFVRCPHNGAIIV